MPQRELSDEFVDYVRFGTGESNVDQGGDCSRRTTTYCVDLVITVTADVHTVEGRTLDGETVVSREVQSGSEEHLQLAEFEPDGQRVEREIVLLDEDGRELDSALAWAECEADSLLPGS